MKTGIILAIMASGSLALAQTTSTTSSEIASSLQVQTSTETLPAAAQTSTKKWGGIFLVQASTDVRDQQHYGDRALIGSEDYLGVNYKLSNMWTVELGYNFSVINNSKAPNVDTASFGGNYEGRSPEVIFKQTLGKIAGSDPASVYYYYYFPMGKYAQQTGGNGVLRLDAFVNWNVRKWSFMPYLSQRAYMGNSANTASTETIYRFNWGGIVSYNFSDAFSAYYYPETDCRSTQLNYSKVQMDRKNVFMHEVGVNWTKKIAKTTVNVNPAFINYQHLDNGQGLGRTYYADNGGETNTAEIDLNLSATF